MSCRWRSERCGCGTLGGAAMSTSDCVDEQALGVGRVVYPKLGPGNLFTPIFEGCLKPASTLAARELRIYDR